MSEKTHPAASDLEKAERAHMKDQHERDAKITARAYEIVAKASNTKPDANGKRPPVPSWDKALAQAREEAAAKASAPARKTAPAAESEPASS